MAIEVFNRYEHKYMLDHETFENVIKILDEHMDMDSHNKGHTMKQISFHIHFQNPDLRLIGNESSASIIHLKNVNIQLPSKV